MNPNEMFRQANNLEILLRLSTIKIEIDKIQEQLIDGVVNSKPLRFDSFAAVRKLGEANLALIEAASEIQSTRPTVSAQPQPIQRNTTAQILER